MADMICEKCKVTLRHTLLLAMAQDAGARVYPPSAQCPKGGDHSFIQPPIKAESTS